MNMTENPQKYIIKNGACFENNLTEHIFSLNIELMNLLKKQTDAFSNFGHLLENLDKNKKNFSFKDKKRVEAIKSKVSKILENINDFQITLAGITYPNEILYEKEAKYQFEVLTDFLLNEIESDEDNEDD